MLTPEKLPDPAPFGSGGYIHVVLFSASAPAPRKPNTKICVLTSMRDEERRWATKGELYWLGSGRSMTLGKLMSG